MARPLPSQQEDAFWSGVLYARRLLASGISAPRRLKDLADVIELVRTLSLPRDLGESLDSSVRAKYQELWDAAQTPERE